MSTRAILFDLDGTLVDHQIAATKAATQWSIELGITPDPDRWNELDQWGFRRFERGECTMQEQRRDRIRAYLQQSLSDAMCDQLLDHYFSIYKTYWIAFDDALPALQRARATGMPVGILTNGAAKLQKQKLLRTGLHFEELAILAATTLDSAKPRTEMYTRALATLKVPTATIIGDDWRNDVEKPRELGWKAWYLDRSGTDERADITCLDELDFS